MMPLSVVGGFKKYKAAGGVLAAYSLDAAQVGQMDGDDLRGSAAQGSGPSFRDSIPEPKTMSSLVLARSGGPSRSTRSYVYPDNSANSISDTHIPR